MEAPDQVRILLYFYYLINTLNISHIVLNTSTVCTCLRDWTAKYVKYYKCSCSTECDSTELFSVILSLLFFQSVEISGPRGLLYLCLTLWRGKYLFLLLPLRHLHPHLGLLSLLHQTSWVTWQPFSLHPCPLQHSLHWLPPRRK